MQSDLLMIRRLRSMAWSILALIAVCVSAPHSTRAAYPNPLDGFWRFEVDPEDRGAQQQWFNRDLRNRIRLPGILQAQGFGDEISTNTPWVLSLYDRNWYLRDDYKAYIEPGKVKVPFLSQPPRHYLAAASYQRHILIDRYMIGRRIVLTRERPHWVTTFWIDE